MPLGLGRAGRAKCNVGGLDIVATTLGARAGGRTPSDGQWLGLMVRAAGWVGADGRGRMARSRAGHEGECGTGGESGTGGVWPFAKSRQNSMQQSAVVIGGADGGQGVDLELAARIGKSGRDPMQLSAVAVGGADGGLAADHGPAAGIGKSGHDPMQLSAVAIGGADGGPVLPMGWRLGSGNSDTTPCNSLPAGAGHQAFAQVGLRAGVAGWP